MSSRYVEWVVITKAETLLLKIDKMYLNIRTIMAQ